MKKIAADPAWANEGLIQDVCPICGCEDHHSLVALKTIHLGKQLVHSLLTFVIALSEAWNALVFEVYRVFYMCNNLRIHMPLTRPKP